MPLYWRNEADYDFTAELTPERWAWEFLRRNPKYRQGWHEKLGGYEARRRWHLFTLVDPDQDEPNLRFTPRFLAAKSGPLDDIGWRGLAKHEAVILFDLREPLKWLAEGTRGFLRDLQADYKDAGGKVRHPINRPEIWRRYLRALDAKADGARYAEMAEVFFPVEQVSEGDDTIKMVEGILGRARQMTEPSAYIKILR